MSTFRRNRFRRKHPERPFPAFGADGPANPENTGSEAAYLKSLIDTHAKVTVALKTGERLKGHIRYYDRDCFSLGPVDGGPKIFLLKRNVSYIAEE